jgi:putative transcriptional regulator
MTHAPGHPSDRALDALLAAYASGSLSPPLHVLVAGHLALSPQSRAFVRHLEAANAAALEETTPEPISDREGKLEAIFASADHEPVAPEPGPDDVLPAALVHYLGTRLDGIRWRTLLPGIREYKAERTARGEAVLYWVRRGRSMPSHTHEGTEYTLVLRGGFTDVTGHYRRGDIAIADQEIDHRPRSDRDEDCICYTVSDAPLRLTGPVGRLLERLRFGRPG